MTENEKKILRLVADCLYNAAYARTQERMFDMTADELTHALTTEYNDTMYDVDANEYLSDDEFKYVLKYACETFVK